MTTATTLAAEFITSQRAALVACGCPAEWVGSIDFAVEYQSDDGIRKALENAWEACPA